jgi:hypothetical protein
MSGPVFVKSRLMASPGALASSDASSPTDAKPSIAASGLEQLAALKPIFTADGTVTAGNAPGVNDGAGAFVPFFAGPGDGDNFFTQFARFSRLCRAFLAQKSVMKQHTVEADEGLRPDTSLEQLAALKPIFTADGTVTGPGDGDNFFTQFARFSRLCRAFLAQKSVMILFIPPYGCPWKHCGQKVRHFPG